MAAPAEGGPWKQGFTEQGWPFFYHEHTGECWQDGEGGDGYDAYNGYERPDEDGHAHYQGLFDACSAEGDWLRVESADLLRVLDASLRPVPVQYPKDTVELALDYKSLVYAIRPGIVIPEKEQKETPAKSPAAAQSPQMFPKTSPDDPLSASPSLGLEGSPASSGRAPEGSPTAKRTPIVMRRLSDPLNAESPAARGSPAAASSAGSVDSAGRKAKAEEARRLERKEEARRKRDEARVAKEEAEAELAKEEARLAKEAARLAKEAAREAKEERLAKEAAREARERKEEREAARARAKRKEEREAAREKEASPKPARETARPRSAFDPPARRSKAIDVDLEELPPKRPKVDDGADKRRAVNALGGISAASARAVKADPKPASIARNALGSLAKDSSPSPRRAGRAGSSAATGSARNPLDDVGRARNPLAGGRAAPRRDESDEDEPPKPRKTAARSALSPPRAPERARTEVVDVATPDKPKAANSLSAPRAARPGGFAANALAGHGAGSRFDGGARPIAARNPLAPPRNAPPPLTRLDESDGSASPSPVPARRRPPEDPPAARAKVQRVGPVDLDEPPARAPPRASPRAEQPRRAANAGGLALRALGGIGATGPGRR